MEPINIPLVPQWNLISGCCSTPDDGFLYIGVKTINYISKVKENTPPIFKIFHTRQRVKCLDCDPDWSSIKYFAVLADDNSVQIWDFNEGKAKKGHRAHIKVFGDGDGPSSDIVKLCFLRDRTVLSIDSQSLIQYCISSNTYTKSKRIIPVKHDISIIKGSPYDDKIFAAGTSRGLVLIIDLKSESVLYFLRGHDTEITSLSWMRVIGNMTKTATAAAAAAATITPTTSERNNRKSQKLLHQSNISAAADDDIFDIYDFDYLENEFGAPTRPKLAFSDDEGNSVNERVQDSVDNENFNFVEACQNLKSDILASNAGDCHYEGVSGMSQKPVTLKDCQQSEAYNSASSFSCQSNQSLDLGDRSTTESCKEGDYSPEPSQIVVDIHKVPEIFEEDIKSNSTVYLASGSHEPTVWVWNVQSGAAEEKLQLKNSSQNILIDVCWINELTILTNSRAGELMLWTGQISKANKLSFKHEKRTFNHRGVTSFCKLQNNDIIWTISCFREIACEDITQKIFLAKYSCASSNIAQIKERPDDMNKLALACADRRIGLMNLSNISHNNITIENFSNKIDASVLTLTWCSKDSKLVFATADGRVGILDTEKSNSVPITMSPFCGKSIYSVVCTNKHIIACGGDKIAFYDINGKVKDPHVLPDINNASQVSVKDSYLLVGTQSGNIDLYARENISSFNFKLISSQNIGPKYISEIDWSILRPTRCVISSASSIIAIMSLSDGGLHLEKTLALADMTSGNASVKWSHHTENVFLSCGFDGAVRVWDLNAVGNELIFVKRFICPMLCGLFSPLNKNIVICAGKSTSIEMFDISKESDTMESKETRKKSKEKPLEAVVWANKIKSNVSISKEKKKNRKRGKCTETEHLDDSEVEVLRNLMGSDWGPSAEKEIEKEKDILHTEGTIFHLSVKETNKGVLDTILNILQTGLDSINENLERNETDNTKESFHKNSKWPKKFLTVKLFGSKNDVQDVLNEEIKNHQDARTKSIGHMLLPQINGNLKEEILTCIQKKKLTEFHLSLAPTISHSFWRNCCLAYANQLLELNQNLRAIPYLLACHDSKEAIRYLMEKNYFCEAWTIAKMYREIDDPILERILGKWIEYLDYTGNLEGAALICILSEKYKQAVCLLEKRRKKTEVHLKIIEILNKK